MGTVRGVGTVGTVRIMRTMGGVGAVGTVRTVGNMGGVGAVGTVRTVGNMGGVGAVGTMGVMRSMTRFRNSTSFPRYMFPMAWNISEIAGMCSGHPFSNHRSNNRQTNS
ncbi:MAG: hypothetical protein DRH33_05025 [Candidatus Nealsonbacteria bacterium]|nr:MAG: hypothetical protein DRH33_05025 [Candidatus Nealsonbacteria bacterium]